MDYIDGFYCRGGSGGMVSAAAIVGLGLMTESSMIRLQKNVMAEDKMKDLA